MANKQYCFQHLDVSRLLVLFVVVRRPFSYTLMKSKLYSVFIYVHNVNEK